MAILILPSWYKTESNPILGSFFREQAIMLKEAGEQVIVADATFQGRADYFSNRCFKLKKYNDEGLLTYSLVEPGFGTFKRKDGGSKRYYKNLRKIYKKILADGYDVEMIHAHSYLPAGVAAVRLGKEEHIPVIVTEHSSAVLEKELTPYRVQLLRSVVGGTKAFICVSHALKRAMDELMPCESKLEIIPNPVNKDFVYKKEQKKNDKFTFISIGNLVNSKRFDLTIKAFAAAFAGNVDVQLKILGDGILKNELELLAKEQKVENQVAFLGRVSRETVLKELQKSHIFVLPSDYETFGVVYVEALACGLPVIGTKNGGAEDIISEGNGYLIERNDVKALILAMKNAYDEYKNFDYAQIANECQGRFGEQIILDKLLNVYHRYVE